MTNQEQLMLYAVDWLRVSRTAEETTTRWNLIVKAINTILESDLYEDKADALLQYLVSARSLSTLDVPF